jgi:hypothetical protein
MWALCTLVEPRANFPTFSFCGGINTTCLLHVQPDLVLPSFQQLLVGHGSFMLVVINKAQLKKRNSFFLTFSFYGPKFE